MRELNQGHSRDADELARFIEWARAEKPIAWARVEALRTACFDEASRANLEKHALLFALGWLEVDARSPRLGFARTPTSMIPR